MTKTVNHQHKTTKNSTSRGKVKINGKLISESFGQGIESLLNYKLLFMVNNAFRVRGEINKKGKRFIKIKYSHCANTNTI